MTMASKTTKKTLWEINAEFEELAQQMDALVVQDGKFVNEETGEAFDLDVFDRLETEKEEKMKNCLYIYKVRYGEQLAGIEGRIAFQQKILDDLKAQRESIASRQRVFGNYIMFCTNHEKWKAEDGTFSCYTRENESTDVFDEDIVPEEYYTTETKKKFAKPDIKQAIKDGKNVPGCRILKSYSLIAR